MCRDFPIGAGQDSPAPADSFMKMITVASLGTAKESALHAGSRATTGYLVKRERRGRTVRSQRNDTFPGYPAFERTSGIRGIKLVFNTRNDASDFNHLSIIIAMPISVIAREQK